MDFLPKRESSAKDTERKTLRGQRGNRLRNGEKYERERERERERM
jgi:hypothetical protein